MKTLISYFILVLFFNSICKATTIKGKIIDETQQGIPFATVILNDNKPDKKGIQTDFDGNYEFTKLYSGIYDIKVAYPGYETITKKISVRDSISTITENISLVPSTKSLEQVQIIEYKRPLIHTETYTQVDLNIKPTRKVESIVASNPGVYIDQSKTVSGTVTTSYNWSANKKYKETTMESSIDVYDKEDYYYDQINRNPIEKDNISNNEDYAKIIENKFISSNENSISTFSIDVDNASYSNVRRMISYNQMPPKDAVRIEEMVNYFKYQYNNPTGEDPFSVNTEMMSCPWNSSNKILMIGMQGKQLDYNQINPSNLVFLIDVSGSMSDANKLPLVKQSLKILVDNLQATDKIALVVYAGSSGLVLPSTEVRNKETILKAIDNLQSGGSTAGGAGIKLAYKIAEENLIAGGNNRVVMCTDGDFNVGVSSDEEMKKLIESEREKKIYVSMIGFGMGNYKDSKMETIANNGNGNYFYIDNINEATKVFKTDMKATLFTIAKDVKLQLYFNPEKIASYRLIGYENRIMAKEDFDNDKKDAGELGAGHTVTALYEVVLKNENTPLVRIDNDLSKELAKEEINFNSDDYLVLKMRYKKPDETTSKLLISHLNTTNVLQSATPSENIRFASSVALFGMLLRGSTYANKATYFDALSLAESAKGIDKEGYRKEFIEMIKSVNLLAKK
jgi:Ca-activated chloride channel family protein